MDWRISFYESKYHLSIAKRMFETYKVYPEKRILIGIIRETAKASAKLITSFLSLEKTHGGIQTFTQEIAPKYMDEKTAKDIRIIIEIEKTQRFAKVEFTRKDEILLESRGGWKILKVARLVEIINSIEKALLNFPTDIKR